jgi:hypothetical protein
MKNSSGNGVDYSAVAKKFWFIENEKSEYRFDLNDFKQHFPNHLPWNISAKELQGIQKIVETVQSAFWIKNGQQVKIEAFQENDIGHKRDEYVNVLLGILRDDK